MFDIAAHGDGDPISAAAIAERQGISLSYLEQLLLKLKRGELVKTVKGPAGGYRLAKPPAQISIGEIILAADGPVALADCVPSFSACPRSGCCSTRSLWKKLSEKVTKILDSTTLEDLCRENKHG